jgi:hypothetical protein
MANSTPKIIYLPHDDLELLQVVVFSLTMRSPFLGVPFFIVCALRNANTKPDDLDDQPFYP